MSKLPPLSLYIHLPWCVSKCPYCDFNSYAVDQRFDEDAYIDALCADLACDSVYIADRELVSIFIGGGTPSLFSADALDRLLSEVRKVASMVSDCEITLEANPESTSLAYLKDLYQVGINRVSLGIQSFDDEALQRLGRAHDAKRACDAIEAVRQAGFQNFNIDLMFGLPGQSLQQGMADISRAIDYKPSHISYYQLTLEPNTKFYKTPPILPSHDDVFQLQQNAMRMLHENDYPRYEVSAFSKTPCRHNLNYWRFGDYLGIGAGAHGKLSISLPDHIIRTRKIRTPKSYIDHAQRGSCRIEEQRLYPEDLAFEFLMNALRLSDGVESDLFSRRTGLPDSFLQEKIANQVTQGKIEYRGDNTMRASPAAYPFLDQILEDCLAFVVYPTENMPHDMAIYAQNDLLT